MRWLAYKLLILLGWTFHGEVPDIPKMIIIGAPHTTNWDFVLFLGALHHFRLDVSFMGKHTLFRWPFGGFFRAMGGFPVDRNKPGGAVGQVADEFEKADGMILVIAPEGTRGVTDVWKSGFVNIAEAAEVPVVLASVDGPSKRVTIGPALHYQGDIKSFMDDVRGFFADKRGIRPELTGSVALAEERTS